MKGWIVIALVAISILFVSGVFLAGYKYKKCPEPIPVDTRREDSAMVAAAQWEGMAKSYRIERDEARRLRDIYKKSIPTTSATINRIRREIRSAGFSAAIDTLRKRPVE
jgi:hypothetical protein